jgi:hypothetical protein
MDIGGGKTYKILYINAMETFLYKIIRVRNYELRLKTIS